MQIVKKVITCVNLPRFLCTHLFGHHHSLRHRMGMGAGVMMVGVTVAKVAHTIEFLVVALIVDGIGYALHGLGAAPYVEYLIDAAAKEHQEPERRFDDVD